jgi:uncharacterized coiled-coil DUF342 family protein
MGFLDKAKAAAEQAATRAKETADELYTKRELGQAYDELGRKTYELVEAGQISASALDPLVERIRTLKAQLDQGGAPTANTESSDSSAQST